MPDFEGRTCECCGHADHLAGIASDWIGAFSILWCSICLSMDAHPKWAVDASRGVINEGDEPDPNCLPLTYYDQATDRYVDTEKGPIFVEFNDGFKAATRKEAGDHLMEIVKNITPEEISEAARKIREERRAEKIAEIEENLIEMWDDAHKAPDAGREE